MYYMEYPSPLGPCLLVSDGFEITELQIGVPLPADAEAGTCPVLDAAARWLDDYFGGVCRAVDFPLAPQGTAFQQQVWDCLKKIPYGALCTYGDIAREIGCRSPQAVGQAVGRNPIAIIIPCHRVIGAREQLTGYAWGLEKKKWLLEQEARKRR